MTSAERSAEGRDGATTTTRRRLLRAAAGAGAAGAVSWGATGATTGQATQFEDGQWQAHVGTGVVDYDLTVDPVSGSDPTDEPSLDTTFEDDAVVVTGYWDLDDEGCRTVRPRGIEYDPDRDLLAVDVTEVAVPEQSVAAVRCFSAATVVRFDLAIELAADVQPGGVRVAPRPNGTSLTPVRYATRGGDGFDGSEPGVEYEFETEPAEQPASPWTDAPTIDVRDDEVLVSGVVRSYRCTEFEPRGISFDPSAADAALAVELHLRAPVGVPVGRSCDTHDVSYTLRLEPQDGVPDRISVVESARDGPHRRTVVRDPGATVDGRTVQSAAFTATMHTEDAPEEPVVRFGDGRFGDPDVAVQGLLETCDPALRTLDASAVDLRADGETTELAAEVRDRALDRPPRYPAELQCTADEVVYYRLAVDVDGPPPDRVAVTERGLDHDRTHALDREQWPPLPEPAGVRAVGSMPDAVAVDWESVSEADGYEVSLDGERVVRTETGYVTGTHLRAWDDDATYDVAVRARDEVGRVSAAATTTATTPPATEGTPGTVAVEVVTEPGPDRGVASIQVRDLPPDAAVAGYRLRLATVDDGSIYEIGPPSWYGSGDPNGAPFVLTDQFVHRYGNDARLEGTAIGDSIAAEDGTVELATVEYRPETVGNPPRIVDRSVVLEAASEGPPALGSTEPRDLNGDGVYRDVTGDGDLGLADVDAFQSHLFDDAVQNNAQYFDFADSGDGAVSHGDVVALFGDVTGL